MLLSTAALLWLFANDSHPGTPMVITVLEVQDVRLDPVERRAWRRDTEIALSPKEFDLVHYLIARAGTTVPRDELMLAVWHSAFWSTSNTIDVHLGWVRRKLGDDTRHPTLIRTVRGKGLRFELDTPIPNNHPPLDESPPAGLMQNSAPET